MPVPSARRRIPKDPWWHVAGLSLGLAFALLLMAARLDPGYLDLVDMRVEAAFAPLQTLRYVEFFLAVTALGSGIGVTLVGLGAAFLLRRNWFAVLQLGFLLLCASVSMGIAKTFVARLRPESLLWVDPLNTFSFPSGHATLATALYTFLAVCLYRRVRQPLLRYLAVMGCLLVLVLVCVSRLVLNVHYFTDVLAGMLLGLFWLAVVFMLPRPR